MQRSEKGVFISLRHPRVYLFVSLSTLDLCRKARRKNKSVCVTHISLRYASDVEINSLMHPPPRWIHNIAKVCINVCVSEFSFPGLDNFSLSRRVKAGSRRQQLYFNYPQLCGEFAIKSEGLLSALRRS